MMAYKETLQLMVDLEDEVFIDVDASIHKATQENGEFQEALSSGDVTKIIDEAADAVTNTLIATFRVIGEAPDENDFFSSRDIVNLTIKNYKRNDGLQTFRKIYSRNTKTITKKEILNRTSEYVSGVLGHVSEYDSSITVNSLLEHSLGKITGRMELYKHPVDIEMLITDDLEFKPGIEFKRISSVLGSPEAMDYITKQLSYRSKDADVIMGLDARGFIFGSLVAQHSKKPFVMARKPNKLPGNLLSVDYGKEYGTDTLCIQDDLGLEGKKVAVIDDLLATGGTGRAANKLIEMAGSIVEGNYFVTELEALEGRKKLKGNVKSMIKYD